MWVVTGPSSHEIEDAKGGGFGLSGAQFNGKGFVAPSGFTSPSDGPPGEAYEGAYASSSSLVDPIQVIRRRFWVIALLTIAVSAAALGFSLLQQPTYEASAKLLVGQEQGGDASGGGNLGNEVQGLQQIGETMVEAVGTRAVAQDVIDKLGLATTPDLFLQNLEAEQIGGSQFIEVAYKDADPATAQRVANAVGDTFSDQVSEVSPSASAITATVWERAVEPDSPVSPDPVRNVLLALALGLMLGVGLAFLLDHLDDNWRSPEEVEQVSGVPTFGVVPTFKVPRAGKPRKKEAR